MAKVTIVIEDKPGNKVTIVSDPNFETMLKMDLSGAALTSGHGYAIAMLNKAREISKASGSKLAVKIPRIHRLH